MPFLTEEERDQLRVQHKKERDKRICDRIKAVLLRDKGWTWMQIADALLLTEEILRKHVQEYMSSRKLKPENGGSQEKLSSEQSKKLISNLEEYTYIYTKDIVAYVSSTFGITYSVSGMCYWLKKNGFSYKKPSLVPGKANRQMQGIWISEYYKLKQSLKKDETICFVDGVHPTHNTQLYCGWIRKGERKEICSNTGRQRLNISGAIELMEGKLHFQEDKMLNVEETITFLNKIDRAYPTKRKIHLFLDNVYLFF